MMGAVQDLEITTPNPDYEQHTQLCDVFLQRAGQAQCRHTISPGGGASQVSISK